tara:strand:+ start:360 stop:494 length:135 start_codon:yes stop_codon:yes gene_type:complete
MLEHNPGFSIVMTAGPALLYLFDAGWHNIPQHFFSGMSPPNKTL